MTESIIVYRSRSEQVQDEFWWNLVESYPTFFVGLIWILFIVVTTTIAYNIAQQYRFPKRRR